MSVDEHLGIQTRQYDQQILTFIPFYEEILDQAAAALDGLERPARVLVDLGIGTGALAACCAAPLRGAAVVGIDSDPQMLAMAAERLGRRLRPVVANFETAPIARCDVVTAAFSLHHIAAPAAKRKVFTKAFRALRPGGLCVIADCMTASTPRLQARDMAGWRDHLAARHGRAGATKVPQSMSGRGHLRLRGNRRVEAACRIPAPRCGRRPAVTRANRRRVDFRGWPSFGVGAAPRGWAGHSREF